jgi:hypothetical protein
MTILRFSASRFGGRGTEGAGADESDAKAKGADGGTAITLWNISASASTCPRATNLPPGRASRGSTSHPA